MKRQSVLYVSAATVALLGTLGIYTALQQPVFAQATPAPARGTQPLPPTPPTGPGTTTASTATPVYKVQPLFPQPLPNHWAQGAISGVTVDSKDTLWVVNRGPASFRPDEIPMIAAAPSSRVCCLPSPSVVQFDTTTGRVISYFGGPTYGYQWPQNTGGIAVDGQGNVWIAAYGLDPAPAGRGRGAAPAGAPPVAVPGATAPPTAPGAAPAGGRGGRGRGADGAAAPPAGAPPAAGGAAPAPAAGGAAPAPAAGAPAAGGADAAGGRGRGGRGGGGAAPAAAGTTAPAQTAPATTAPPAAAQAPAGRGAPAAPAAPVVADAHVIKFSPSGQVVLTIGTPGQPGTPDSRTGLNRPAGIAVDDAASEVYIADSGNHRIVVFDSNTGAYKRHWGGSGQAPTAAGGGAYDPAAPPSPQFRDPYCVKIAKDGQVYVCDRSSNRIQVFQKDGKFVKEMVIAKETGSATAAVGSIPLLSAGSVWDIAFSNDTAQRWLFVADGHNKKIRILRRETLAEAGSIGGGGRYPGRFLTPSTVAVDSRGNLFTGEAYHTKRVQKFVR